MGENTPVRPAGLQPLHPPNPALATGGTSPSARPLMPPDTVQMDSRTVQRRSFASFSAADEMNNEWISVLTSDGDYGSLQRTRSFGSLKRLGGTSGSQAALCFVTYIILVMERCTKTNDEWS